jgi:short-subunit dehydrogenase
VASVHGLVASVEKSAYVAAKHGLVGLTRVTALENATTGVTCNAICPGWVLTPLVKKQVDAKYGSTSSTSLLEFRPSPVRGLLEAEDALAAAIESGKAQIRDAEQEADARLSRGKFSLKKLKHAREHLKSFTQKRLRRLADGMLADSLSGLVKQTFGSEVDEAAQEKALQLEMDKLREETKKEALEETESISELKKILDNLKQKAVAISKV